MAVPNINGQMYAWASITFSAFGGVLRTAQSIDYSDEEEMELIYGANKYPVGYGTGNVNYEGSITLLLDEVQELKRLSPTRRLQDLPAFPITVSYAVGSKRFTDIIIAKFMAYNISTSQNDKSIPVELPLLVLSINAEDLAANTFSIN